MDDTYIQQYTTGVEEKKKNNYLVSKCKRKS